MRWMVAPGLGLVVEDKPTEFINDISYLAEYYSTNINATHDI